MSQIHKSPCKEFYYNEVSAFHRRNMESSLELLNTRRRNKTDYYARGAFCHFSTARGQLIFLGFKMTSYHKKPPSDHRGHSSDSRSAEGVMRDELRFLYQIKMSKQVTFYFIFCPGPSVRDLCETSLRPSRQVQLVCICHLMLRLSRLLIIPLTQEVSR